MGSFPMDSAVDWGLLQFRFSGNWCPACTCVCSPGFMNNSCY